ncbi:hypothetical protein [Adhaeribacter radiodurans]|uniref:Outer membrane beta-barrel protein n=1 Tax=Adhaeribacter radiodurans TaxID=2745197 RepID=A0A7L7LDG9_9BACT|nr:hypothetical protein [Adhaeribacter radiodurans]QMU30744.1 hypothetical protein HUW48_23150 [Adhaeribacter radiodurans]
MKKALMLLVLVATFTSFAHAQGKSDSTQTRKPQAGNFTTELTLGLFTTNYFNNYNGSYGYQNNVFSLGNILSQIRGRYFYQNNKAFRLSFNYEHNSNNNAYSNNYKSTRSGNTFTINPGLEKHFKGTSRLSPYIGTELALTAGRYHENLTDINTSDKIEVRKGWYNYAASNNYDEGYLYARNFNAVGLRGLVGLDYYVLTRFYLGLEFGYSVSYSKYKDVKIVQQEPATDVTFKGYSSWNSGAYANSGIRAGFVF